jgi:hypothetical protein
MRTVVDSNQKHKVKVNMMVSNFRSLWTPGTLEALRVHHHHRPINIPTARVQACLMDYT